MRMNGKKDTCDQTFFKVEFLPLAGFILNLKANM